MQSEEFDIKMKEAAENHHPAYDEKAWAKMEDLLDKHLPQKKEKKRRFIFLLFFLLLLGGAGYIFFGTGNSGKSSKELVSFDKGKTKTTVDQTGKQDLNKPINPIHKDNLETKDVERHPQDIKGVSSTVNNNDRDIISIAGMRNNIDKTALVKSDYNNRSSKNRKSRILTKEEIASKGARDRMAENKILDKTNPGNEKDFVITRQEDPIIKAIQSEPGKDNVKTTDPAIDKKENPIITNESRTIDTLSNLVAKNDSQKGRSKKKGSFIISASVAPDLSVVGLSQTGKVKLAAGVGVGYNKGRFTLRTGFYSARKVYDAYADNYHAPAGFYYRYPNLQEVKADCRVYEIPVLLSYNFGKGSKRNWFASTGLSTYLMKRETYNYFYKYTSTSPVTSRERTITNDNQHYFSVLTFSGGYQRSINKRLSLVAEPYVKIPVTGIGFGKVKLNSAGVLFSLTYRPFLSKIK